MNSQLEVRRYKGFKGGFFNSTTHADIFHLYGPHKFGVMTSKLFSSTSALGLTNKRWVFMTVAQGNVYYTDPGVNEYQWEVAGDADIDITIMEDVLGANTTPGKNKGTFDLILDTPFCKSPMVFKTDSDNAPLLIAVSKDSEPYGSNYWKTTFRLQDGNPNSYIETKWLQPGHRLIRYGTFVANEENPEYGIDEYNSMRTLRAPIGQYANHIVFTDRFIRRELAYSGGGAPNNMKYTDAFGKPASNAYSSGIIYQKSLMDESNKEIRVGFLIPSAEKRLLERTEADLNNMCEHGRTQYMTDDNNYVKKMANGWRQLVRDGQYLPHGGDFSIQDLYEFLHQVMFRRRRFMNREPYLVGGTGAITYLSTLIAAQASVFQTTDWGVLGRDVAAGDKTGVHKYEKEWGFQFTRLLLPQGITVSIMYDPEKDNDQVYREPAPGSSLPLESFQIDILEFGQTEDAAENASGENICMVKERGADYYFSISNQVDWKKGHVISGENTYAFNKTYSSYREMSGSLGIWDVGAVGRIEWIPGLAA